MMKKVQQWLIVSMKDDLYALILQHMPFEAHFIFFYSYIGSNTWKSEGCSTYKISADVVGCNCDHMTPFAVLLVSTETTTHESKSSSLDCLNVTPPLIYLPY